MAIYLKCPNCGLHFMDMFGEHVKDDSEDCYMHGPYVCPVCNTDAEGITAKEYSNAPKELKWKGYGNT